MEKDKFDSFIRQSLGEDTEDIRMSLTLKDNILKSTVKRPDTIFKRFSRLMDKTIEISIPSAIVAGVVLLAVVLTGFNALNDTKKDRSLEGYTNIKVIDMGGYSIIVDDKSPGGDKFEVKIKD